MQNGWKDVEWVRMFEFSFILVWIWISGHNQENLFLPLSFTSFFIWHGVQFLQEKLMDIDF